MSAVRSENNQENCNLVLFNEDVYKLVGEPTLYSENEYIAFSKKMYGAELLVIG